MMSSKSLVGAAWIASLALAGFAAAQPPGPSPLPSKSVVPLPGRAPRVPANLAAIPKDGIKTIVDVDIIIPSVGAGAEVQEWGRFFQTLGISAQLRQGNIDERPATTESVRGTLRTVQVVGRLDGRGRILFADRTVSSADREKLKEWMDELKVYGAQGTPDGKPSWGLNREQFEALFEAMGARTEGSFEGMTLAQVLADKNWKTAYPLRMHTSAEAFVRDLPGEHRMRISPAELSRGTALACLLEDVGLGFRPQRTPAGNVELMVYPLAALRDPWPMGWPLDPVQPRNEIAPGYFRSGPVDFEQKPLAAVLAALAQQAGLPILIDHPRCEAKKVDPQTVLVSHPARKLAYALVVNSVVHQARLTAALKLDEAGQPFVQVYPFEPRPVTTP